MTKDLRMELAMLCSTGNNINDNGCGRSGNLAKFFCLRVPQTHHVNRPEARKSRAVRNRLLVRTQVNKIISSSKRVSQYRVHWPLHAHDTLHFG